jgi:hypothetical protein
MALLQLGLTWLSVDLAHVVHTQRGGGCIAREFHAPIFWRRVWARAEFYGGKALVLESPELSLTDGG